jgi:hypothetical protein
MVFEGIERGANEFAFSVGVLSADRDAPNAVE